MITIDMEKARAIGHDIRRRQRAEEFAPLDVQVTIPSIRDEAEKKRQAVREKYADMQQIIDLAQTPDEIKEALSI